MKEAINAHEAKIEITDPNRAGFSFGSAMRASSGGCAGKNPQFGQSVMKHRRGWIRSRLEVSWPRFSPSTADLITVLS